MRLQISASALLLAAGVFACTSPSSDADSEATAQPIIGGVAAKSASLDAVGALMHRETDGSFRYYCTATLVASRLVLTAKHCAPTQGSGDEGAEDTYFGIGEDSHAPKLTAKVVRAWESGLSQGGFISRGSDVALLVLDRAITDIAPLPVADGHVSTSLVGERVSAVGFGIRDLAKTEGNRRAGTLTIRATSGSPYQTLFPTADALVAFTSTEASRFYDPTLDEATVRALWDFTLLPDHEVMVGIAPGDAQPCSGDSGGPLVARFNGGLAVVAVVSGSPKLKDPAARCGVLGQIYSTFPADVQTMFDEAAAAARGTEGPTRVHVAEILEGSSSTVPEASGQDRCGAVPIPGNCQDGAIIRCVSSDEGAPRITRTDCKLLMQTCSTGESDAQATGCVDP